MASGVSPDSSQYLLILTHFIAVLAGDARLTRLLLGLGLTEFSMHPQQLLDVKREVRRAHSNALRVKVAAALNRALPIDPDTLDAL